MCSRYNHPSTCPSQCHRAAGRGAERADRSGGPAAEQVRPECPPLPGREVLSPEVQLRPSSCFASDTTDVCENEDLPIV